MKQVWTKDKEIEFFKESRKFVTPEQLFYVSDDKRYFANRSKSKFGGKTTFKNRFW